jgi:hypothetical protein
MFLPLVVDDGQGDVLLDADDQLAALALVARSRLATTCMVFMPSVIGTTMFSYCAPGSGTRR